MAVYDSGSMDRMRMEAVRRSREMHRRSQQEEPVFSHEEKDRGIPVKQQGRGAGDFLGKLFSDGKPDSDVLLTAALIYLLYKEGADIKLMLALAYILL